MDRSDHNIGKAAGRRRRLFNKKLHFALDMTQTVLYNVSSVQRQQVRKRKSCREYSQYVSFALFSLEHEGSGFFLQKITCRNNESEVNQTMPNAKVLSEKQAIVSALVEDLKAANSGVLVDYKGITVAEDTALRHELRENGVEYAVVKNTLLRRALDDVELGELDGVLNGTTSMAISKDDPIAPMRIINKYAKQLGDRFNIKAGFMDGKVLPLDDVYALAELPSKEVLLGQVLGMMLAPITSLAIVLKAIAEKGGEAPAAEVPAGDAPAEEAPAAEAPAAE